MRPLAQLPPAVAAGVRAVLLDLDDTLTTAGRLTAAAYGALERLCEAGLLVVPVTGRPAGWCDHLARMWPIDAVVGENGAFYFRCVRDPASGRSRMVRRFVVSQEARRAAAVRLARLRCEILAAVPGSGVASDQPYRESDLAIDYREDVAPLPAAAVRRIVALFEAAGARAKVSSIHVNGWFGDFDKLATTRLLLAEEFGIDADAERERLIFVGDSPNDAPMFAHFPHAVGVANVRAFAHALPAAPAYVTRAESGAGFLELAAALLRARAGSGV